MTITLNQRNTEIQRLNDQIATSEEISKCFSCFWLGFERGYELFLILLLTVASNIAYTALASAETDA